MIINIDEDDLLNELMWMLDLNYNGEHNTGHNKIKICMKLSKENRKLIAESIVEGLKPVYGLRNKMLSKKEFNEAIERAISKSLDGYGITSILDAMLIDEKEEKELPHLKWKESFEILIEENIRLLALIREAKKLIKIHIPSMVEESEWLEKASKVLNEKKEQWQPKEDKTMKKDTIKLSIPEMQSGLTRVKFAEELILQLPKVHEGRNTWLLNYGIGEESNELRQNFKGRDLHWNKETESLNPTSYEKEYVGNHPTD